jgi:hypothetical protein
MLYRGYSYKIIPTKPIIKRYIIGTIVFIKRKEVLGFSKVKNNERTNS